MSEDTEQINSATADASPQKAEEDREKVLQSLTPRDRATVEQVLEAHPLLAVEEALQALREAGM